VSRGFVDRILDFMGFGEVPDDTYNFTEKPTFQTDEGPKTRAAKRRRSLVALPKTTKSRLIVTEPESFDDIPGILNNLKKEHPVIIRVSDIDRELARRVLDFVGGAIFVLDGSIQRVSEGVFLFTPSSFEIGLDLPEGEETWDKLVTPFFNK
jgi:cell division inhibitor SepF